MMDNVMGQEAFLRCPSCGGDLMGMLTCEYRRVRGIGGKVRWCHGCGLIHHTDIDGKVRWCRPGKREW